VDVGRDLVHASWAAVGVADEDGLLSHFIVSRGDGASNSSSSGEDATLAAILRETGPFATTNIQEDPQFSGWPPGYPDLKSFLRVPIHSRNEIVGAFCLANENTWGFSREHQDLIELLAPHAGLAIRNARLHDQSLELSVVQERNRLARELHDSVTQTLFSMKLAAETAAALLDEDPAGAREEIKRLQEQARHATSEMRALIFELRPPELESDGLLTTLRKHIEVLQRVHPTDIELQVDGEWDLEPRQENEVFRIVQEALNNAIKHSRAATIVVDVSIDASKLRISVTDDGIGFSEGAGAGRRFGLVSMSERAEAIGAALSISSRPGEGTVVMLELS
jgi:signal transduction histidine kinase